MNNPVSGGAFVTANTKESSWLNVQLVWDGIILTCFYVFYSALIYKKTME